MVGVETGFGITTDNADKKYKSQSKNKSGDEILFYMDEPPCADCNFFDNC